jgi:LPS-assembly protein
MAKATSCCDAATTGSPDRRSNTGDTEVGFFASRDFRFGSERARRRERDPLHRPDHYEATDASYTTCVAPHPDWYLRGEELEVDNLRKVGTARRVSVHFLDVPVLYAPWLQFPLSNERKSGFLTPTLGSTGVRGFEATTPYYLNLAPNYDATITPRLMTKRGLQLGAQFRYLLGEPEDLFCVAAGEMNAEILPHDRATGEIDTRSPGSTPSSSRRGSAAFSTSTRYRTTSISPILPTASP